MNSVHEQLQIFVRRFGLLNASCCDQCCGEQVSMVQSHILFDIGRRKAPSMQQVADDLGIDVTTFSRQIKALESKGLVTRRPSEKDRRVSLLQLSDEGRRVLEQIDSFMAKKLEQVFAFMTPFEKESVVRSLTHLNEAVLKAGCCESVSKTVAVCK